MSRYIYDYKTIGAGRNHKSCSSCGKNIKPGESSITITVYCDEFFNTSVCSKKCYDKYCEDFDKEDEDDEETEEEL